MESDKGKLFVANLRREATRDSLITYFSEFGEVKEALIVLDKETGASKGFGFVTFEDPAVAETVLKGNHMILSQKVDVKRAKPKNQQRREGNDGIRENRNHRDYSDYDKNYENNNSFSDSGPTWFSHKKIFVGGLPPNITEEEFRRFFETFGTIKDVVVMFNKDTGRPRGFGFVTFESEESVDMVLKEKFHKLNDRDVEVKRAEPKIRNHGHTHTYNSSNNSELSDGSGCQYGHSNFYIPMWCPWFGGWVYIPSCFHGSQFSMYDALHYYYAQEEHMNGLVRRSSGEIVEPLIYNYASADNGEDMNSKANGAEDQQGQTKDVEKLASC